MSANRRKSYTVKQVAEIAKVSVRALRFYDEIGLLKPASYGENGYRYYEKEQLLLLQQILFYRELGFELAQIQKILSDPGFDTVKALETHRETLEKESARTQSLIRTIDKTLAHLKMEVAMKDDEMYEGFDPKKQAEYEQYLIDQGGEASQKQIDESKRRTHSWNPEDYKQLQRDYDELHKAFTAALKRGALASDSEVQKLVERHYQVVDRFWTPNRQAYIALGEMYGSHPDFKKLYDGYDPKLAGYLAQAMRVFAETKLQ